MTLKIGVFGTGSFGNLHANILASMEDVEVSAICGSSLEKAERMAQQYRGAKAYGSVKELLDDNPKLDAAYICVPPFAHGEIEGALIERAIPFFVEKPLSTDLDTPTEILQEVKRKKLLTSVGYHFRYMDGTAKAKDLLQTHTVGMALGYWMDKMPDVYWWKKQEGSGGQFVEQTTHIVDLLRYLLGEVEEVNAVYANRYMHTKNEDVQVPDVGTVTLKMKSGAIATLHNTCMMPISHKSGLDIYTDAGVLELSRSGLKEFAFNRTTEYSDKSYNNLLTPYQKESQAFIHALQSGDTAGILSSYEDAWKTQQVTIAANHSAATGQPQKLSH